jgi:hypothetical protein
MELLDGIVRGFARNIVARTWSRYPTRAASHQVARNIRSGMTPDRGSRAFARIIVFQIWLT